MRVRFLEGVAGRDKTYYPKDEADLPDALAQRYIAQGACESVVAKVKRARVREKAVAEARELTVAAE